MARRFIWSALAIFSSSMQRQAHLSGALKGTKPPSNPSRLPRAEDIWPPARAGDGIRIWDTKTHAAVLQCDKPETSQVNRLAYGPDGALLAGLTDGRASSFGIRVPANGVFDLRQ